MRIMHVMYYPHAPLVTEAFESRECEKEAIVVLGDRNWPEHTGVEIDRAR